MLTFVCIAVLLASAHSCGVLNSARIVGGDESDEHEWPWQASLHATSWFGSSSHICGATVIDREWLVTAAHCVDGSSASRLRIVLGEHDKSDNSGNEQTLSVTEVIMHENYRGNSNGFPNDIALLKVNQMTYGTHVQPACLPSSGDSFDGNNNCWITGWGLTQGTGDDDKLNELNVDVRTQAECRSAWGSSYINDGHICVENGDTGACNGDSGGPLVCRVSGRYVLAGATSWGRSGCQTRGYPSVYTRITHFREWIDTNMN